jgi:hypothetical protein
MNIIEKKSIFHINSRNRDSGTDSDFSITLELQKDDEFDKCVILAGSIPKSYYLIASPYNSFKLYDILLGDITITIPEGNYSRRSFQHTVETLLNAASVNYTFEILYAAANSVDKGKFSFKVYGKSTSILIIGSNKVAFKFTTNVFEQLGFNKNSTNYFNNGLLDSANVLKFQLEDSIFLRTDMCDNEGVNENIIQEFYSSSDKTFSNITYQMIDLEANSRNMIQSPSNSFRFYLTDENNLPINLNGLNFNFTLCCYKSNNLSRMLKGFIKLLTLQN